MSTLLADDTLQAGVALCGGRKKLLLSHFAARRGKPENHLERWVKTIATEIYAARKARMVHPEGRFDNAERWYPSGREQSGAGATNCRSPSRTWPFTYMVHCRTRKHCLNLVWAWTIECDVPSDVKEACEKARKVLAGNG